MTKAIGYDDVILFKRTAYAFAEGEPTPMPLLLWGDARRKPQRMHHHTTRMTSVEHMIGRIHAHVSLLFERLGFDGIHIPFLTTRDYPSDFSESTIDICRAVEPYTMTSPERVKALTEAVRYVVESDIRGALVECGVWKGGSAMAMTLALKELGVADRDLFLYDTFSGMTEPDAVDKSLDGSAAQDRYAEVEVSNGTADWCRAPLEEVRENIARTGYPMQRVVFVEGKVEETIPNTVPDRIALLRLDTDWYESTRHELIHLFPRLCKRGVLIVDDYGHWKGAQKAVDAYIAENDISILLNRIDYTGRIGVKT